MHSNGVNLRYLPLVLLHVYNIMYLYPSYIIFSKQDISSNKKNLVLVVLAVEIVVRSANYILRNDLRSTTSDKICTMVTNKLNCILGEGPNTAVYWKGVS